MNLSCKRKPDVRSYGASFFHTWQAMGTSARISPCLPIKHNTSFSCVLLKTTVDCCGYTLSISLSTTMILNLRLILLQAREFEMAILFEVLSRNTLQICVQLTATTCSRYCYLSFSLYDHLFSHPQPPPPSKKAKRHLYTEGHTDRHLLQAVHSDRGGCNWLCTIDPHDS